MKPFPWRVGMRSLPMADDCARIVIGIDPGYVYGVRVGDLRARPDCAALRYDAQPNPTDGATLGALLQAVREELKDPSLSLIRYESDEGLGWGFAMGIARPPAALLDWFPTEFAALLAAWEAAP